MSNAASPTPETSHLPLLLRFALRELRAGLTGFTVFLACLALGVMAIAGVGSVSRSLTEGLAREGRAINGGDVSFSLILRESSPEEVAYLKTLGSTSTIATLRAMARTADGRSTLVEIKAVDQAYPLVGATQTGQGGAIQSQLTKTGDVYPALADLTLFGRFDLKPGDELQIGTGKVRLVDTLLSEPDKLAGGIGFGPRLMMSVEALRATGLIQPGSLVRWNTRIVLPEGTPDDRLRSIETEANAKFPLAGWDVRSRVEAAPQLERNIERFTMFLTLVGLTALVVGGVGVANAVRSFVERKRDTIATLKTLGAPGSTVFAIYLAQTMILGLMGIVIGLAAGAALPFVLAATVGHLLPLPIEPAIYARELGLALVYGLLTALAFALWPLGRAHDVPVSALFRDAIDPGRFWLRWRYVVMVTSATGALTGLAVLFAADRRIALIYIGATAGAFVMLRVVAWAIMAIARRLPRPESTELRLAIANIHRPGALTPSVVLSLGLGLCLLVALTLIDGNISRQLTSSLPERAPSFFFVDIQDAEKERFDAFVKEQTPGGKLERVPMLRGRIVSVKGVPAEKIVPPSNIAWILNGDRGITYAENLPDGSSIVSGAWWPKDYAGPPLVSIEEEVATGLDLKVGDPLVVNVLGRNISASIGAIRKLEWESLGINFVMVFSPNTFAGAPVTHLATISYPKGGGKPEEELALLKAAAQAFPTVTTVRVKDALDAVNGLVSQLAMGIRGAASIALVASVLVLGGALAAGHRARVYDAVVLKTLGATRWRLLTAFVLEYGILGFATALFGIIAGTGAAWLIITQVMDLTFVFLPWTAVVAAFGAMAITIVFGLLGTWRILGQKPAAYLRNL